LAPCPAGFLPSGAIALAKRAIRHVNRAMFRSGMGQHMP
jgi:hypothetical protein